MAGIQKKLKRYKCFLWVISFTIIMTQLSMSNFVYAASIQPLVAAGEFHTILLKSNGTVWTWGDNTNGRLGDGSTIKKYAPVQVLGGESGDEFISDIVSIAAGNAHSVALKKDGTVWTWGYNSLGQLGDGTKVDRKNPVQVKNLAEIKAIAAGHSYTIALKEDGTIWAWGYNGYGQLGDGTIDGKNTPVQVRGGESGEEYLSEIVSIASGNGHSIAIKKDGTVWAWGKNNYGQLGDGTEEKRTTPVQVKSTEIENLTNIIKIAAGDGCSIALRQDGTVWTWGDNKYGQLGDGSYSNKNLPQMILCNDWKESSIIDISVGWYHTVAIDNDGKVWAWGINKYGQVGDNTVEDRNAPYTITLLQDRITSVTAGRSHTVALQEDGVVLAWGSNDKGQLGHNDSEAYSIIPVKVKLPVANMKSKEKLKENKLDGSILTLNLINESFSEPLDTEEFTFNNGPKGLTVSDAVYESLTQCSLILSYDGTDFDLDINNFSISISGSALDSKKNLETNEIAIVAMNEKATITTESELNEDNLHNSILAISLTDESFITNNLSIDSFRFNNAPIGTYINEIEYVDKTYCKIKLSYEGLDFDNDIADFNISIDSSVLSSEHSITTNDLEIKAVLEPEVFITSDQPLIKSNLNGRLLSITLKNVTFTDNQLNKSSFTLNNAPIGLNMANVYFTDITQCLITLAYDESYFSENISNFNILIRGVELSTGADLCSNNLIITTELLPLAIISENLSAHVGSEYREKLQAIGGIGSYYWSAEGLPEGLSLNPITGEISGIPELLGSYEIILTLIDEIGDSVSKALMLQIMPAKGNGKYVIQLDNDSGYIVSTTTEGISIITVNKGVTGFRYFTVNITAEEIHEGDETLVFVHFRNGTPVSIHGLKANYDMVNTASLGLNVQPGDVVKVYIVDELTNDISTNPVLLQ